MILRDPTTQQGMGVCIEGRGLVDSVVKRESQYVNTTVQEVYSFPFDVTPTGAGDCFLYIKNTDDMDLYITSLKCHATTTDEEIQVKINDTGTAVGGTDVTLVNRNAGSGKIPSANSTFQTGVDITGLSGGNTVDYFKVNADAGTQKLSWESAIIIPRNKTFSLYVTTGAIAIKGTVSVFFHECK